MNDNDNDNAKKPKRHAFRSILLLFLLLVLAGFGMYTLGWISIRQGSETITIEIRTRKAIQDGDQAVKKTTVETGKVLQGAGKQLEKLGGGEAQQSSPTPAKKPDNGDKSSGDLAEKTGTGNDAPSPTPSSSPEEQKSAAGEQATQD